MSGVYNLSCAGATDKKVSPYEAGLGINIRPYLKNN
jgi:hypothetical protein